MGTACMAGAEAAETAEEGGGMAVRLAKGLTQRNGEGTEEVFVTLEQDTHTEILIT